MVLLLTDELTDRCPTDLFLDRLVQCCSKKDACSEWVNCLACGVAAYRVLENRATTFLSTLLVL